MLQHSLGLLFRPQEEWQAIANDKDSMTGTILFHLMPMALLPAIAWFYGATAVGWKIVTDEPIRMTVGSVAPIAILFWLGMIGGTLFIGGLMHWMATTYGATPSPARSVRLATYTATPLFIAGLAGFFPILWLDMLLGVAAGCYTIYLLYLGIPRMMDIPEERGYLFASAALGVGFIGCIILMCATVILWEYGFMPEFTD